MKETFGRIDDKPSSVVPVALATICQGRKYIDANKVWAAPDEPKTKEEADTFVDSFCGRLLESIAVSSNGSWMYIVEAEAYMRDAKEVDDCANTTITVDRPDRMKFMIEQKREFQNQWHETKVYFKNFEFLVTGCLCGKYDDEDDDDNNNINNNINNNNNKNSVDAFLGASLGIHVNAGDYWRVYVPVMPVQVVAECRLLHNFTKRAS